MRGLAGLCDRERRTIWIDSRLGRAEREETVVHEVLHACLPESVGVMADAEEALVARLERPLTDILRAGVLVAAPEEAR
jgi:hypothetical protein